MKRSIKLLFSMLALIVVAITTAVFFADAPADGIIALAVAAPLAIASIQTSADAKIERSKIWDQMNAMKDAIKTENRAFNADEEKRFNDLRTSFDKLTDKIKELEADERRALEMAGATARQVMSQQDKRDISRYSLKRAISAKAFGKPLDGIEAEMHKEAENEARANGTSINGLGLPIILLNHLFEKRAMTATGQSSVAGDQGGMTIATEKEGLVMALRPMLVLSQLGARMRGGLVGSIDVVKGTSTVAVWEGENTDADETGISTSIVTTSPKRLAAYGVISKQLLQQSEINFQQEFLNDMLAAVAQAVEAAAINGATGGNNPVGLLNVSGTASVVGGAGGAAPTWDHIVELESKVALNNALVGSLGYLTNFKVKGKLKTTKIDTGSGLFVWPQNENQLNGYPVAVSNLVPSNLTKVDGSTTIENLSAVIFGDFSKLEINQWGGIDIVVDPYTLAGKNQLKITTNSLWDVLIRRPESFAKMVDAIA